mmetsp:Transcript_79407/g.220977  ORF Transcript_79407/g.220977 Transcript_79407/m.220977 type:complete len:225 (-) Transcript_79407:539-1213(-)
MRRALPRATRPRRGATPPSRRALPPPPLRPLTRLWPPPRPSPSPTPPSTLSKAHRRAPAPSSPRRRSPSAKPGRAWRASPVPRRVLLCPSPSCAWRPNPSGTPHGAPCAARATQPPASPPWHSGPRTCHAPRPILHGSPCWNPAPAGVPGQTWWPPEAPSTALFPAPRSAFPTPPLCWTAPQTPAFQHGALCEVCPTRHALHGAPRLRARAMQSTCHSSGRDAA